MQLKRLILILLVIVGGLLSRKISFLPAFLGDALWAAVFLAWGILFPNLSRKKLVLLALLSSWLVECSQLLTWDWLREFRSTTIGHLLLGQGFFLSDLLAYLLGIAGIFLADKKLEKKTG